MNKILRAGPWGDGSDAFKNVPSDTSLNLSYFPVNGEKKNWSNQNWSSYYKKNVGDNLSADICGTVGLGNTISVSGGELSIPTITFEFCYQATAAFTIKMSHELIYGGIGFNASTMGWSYQTIEGAYDSGFDYADVFGEMNVSPPASVFGVVSFYIQGYTEEEVTITANLS
jgi:hypothetical protein